MRAVVCSDSSVDEVAILPFRIWLWSLLEFVPTYCHNFLSNYFLFLIFDRTENLTGGQISV